ncbi:hypothetical protein WQ57_21350 [Mesobacillus campisalis]|uniref:Uncharacterized protein n=1 Tax=Mesobacillus campisalis TaxID=1408103 RepID=A0A0M2SN44_9BACI|nr:hypothetical protein [Mesobacillus campisalis]KKK36069.1 hypothetical protein WQ57_21350 [Mesobacillus campisalis]
MADTQQAQCTCEGANPLLCVAIPCGIEINLLGIEITVGPICINAEEVEENGAIDPKAQLEALQGLFGYLASQV